MIANVSRLFLCLVAIVCLAGCGGSSKSGSTGGGGTPAPTIITYTFEGAAPSIVATQIGAGAYTQATLAAGKLSLSIPSGTTDYAVAWACPADVFGTFTQNIEYVSFGSTLDSKSLYGFCQNSVTATQQTSETLQINAAAIPGAAYVVVAQSLSENVSSNGAATLTGKLNNGTYDIAVVVYDINSRPLAVRILRSQTVPGALNSGSPVVFVASDETTIDTLTYSNLPAGFSNETPYDLFISSGDASFLLTSYAKPLPDNQIFAVPAAAVQSGDYYLLEFVATQNAASSGGFEEVGAAVYTSSPGSLTISYPAPWVYAGPSAAALPAFSFNYTGFAGMPSVTPNAAINWSKGSTSTSYIELSATPSYLGGAASLALPDLSALTGFLAPAPSGSIVQWNASINQSTVSGTTPPTGTFQFVSNNGSYTEP